MKSSRSTGMALLVLLAWLWPVTPAAAADTSVATVAVAAADEVTFARHLALAPDGQTLAFAWAGDIWTVPIDGGVARRLTVHPAVDSDPIWSRDGRRIAFSSTRHGAANVFTMSRDGGDLRRLTFDDRPASPSDWGVGDEVVYFDASREGQIFWEPKAYFVPADGGQPWRAMDCYAADARLSPDGRHLAFVRGRSDWWRRHYRGSANYDVWLYDTHTNQFRQLTDFPGTDRLPCWDADGGGVYFLSERAGNVNVWYQPLDGGAARQITRMAGDDVRDLAVSRDGRTLAFTHWDKLYVQSPPDGTPREISITAPGDMPLTDTEHRAYRGDADEAEVSPDGNEIALVVRGEIFVVKTEDDKLTRRVTHAPARDRDVTWSPDGKALFFVSDRTGLEQIYRATSAEQPPQPLSDSLRFTIEQITDAPEPCYTPAVSPDGKKLAYLRLRGDLIIRDLAGGDEAVLLTSWNAPTYRWSPDSKYVAYAVEDSEHNSDVWIAPADGSGPAVNISRHPDHDGNPQWSFDGRVLAFSSRRIGFDSDLYLVFLSPELDELSKVDLDDYFKSQGEQVGKRKALKKAAASGKIRLAGQPPATQPATQPAPAETQPARSAEKPAEIVAQLRTLLKTVLEEPSPAKKEADKEDEEKKPEPKKKTYPLELATAYQRIRAVTRLPDNQSHFALAPDGSLLAFVSGHEGEAKLYTVKWNGEDRKALLSGAVGGLHWDLAGKKLVYLKGGVPNSCGPTGANAKAHAFAARMSIDYVAEAAQKFNDAARALGLRFYHQTMKGLDWPALTDKYRQLALRTRTVGEFNEIFSMLMGELNASHLAIRGGGRGGGTPDRTGYLGCEFDPHYPGPGLKVSAVVKRSPADRAESKLVPGDILLTVNNQPVGPDQPLDRALIEQVGEPVIVRYIPAGERLEDAGKSAQHAQTTPADDGTAAKEPADDQPPAERTAADGAAAEQVDAAQPDTPTTTTAPLATAPAPPATQPAEPLTRELVIRPVAYAAYAELQYQAWVEAQRQHVERQSEGRVGYLHIRGMDETSFDVFERDLYAAASGKDGLIIDVRNNGGGWTADWILAVLSVRRHAYTVSRGSAPGYPQDRLIFYAWTRPATLMCNQYSFSNAEIIAHAFKNLGRGPLVGMTTFGGVISTGSYSLIDGAFIRMPARGWYTLPGGIDMELNGAEPTVKVAEGPAEEAAGRRPQLDAAIQATLDEIARAQPDIPRP